METHSRLAPSSAEQWINCPASVALQEQHPEDKDSQDALDGQDAHALGACRLGGGSEVVLSNPTDEVERAVQIYVAAVLSVSKGGLVNVERRVDIGIVHPECFGTPDVWWHDTINDVLHVWDFKFGWGIVEAIRNWQLVLYALGISTTVQFKTVELHIVQPRPFHNDGPVRTWRISRGELYDWLPAAKFAAQKVMSSYADCKTGRHCRHCSALYACDTAAQAVLYAIDVSGRATAPTPSPERIGFELTVLRRAEEMIKHRLKATEASALSMCKMGTTIPGWTQEYGAGRVNWKDGQADQVRAMAGLYGAVLDKPLELITPTQAIHAGLPEEIVKMYTEKKPGAAKMVPINFDKLQIAFGGSDK